MITGVDQEKTLSCLIQSSAIYKNEVVCLALIMYMCVQIYQFIIIDNFL